MSEKSDVLKQIKEWLEHTFEDQKVREFALHVLFPRIEKAEDGSVIKIAHNLGGKRSDPDAAASGLGIAFHVDKVSDAFCDVLKKKVRFEHTFFGDGLRGPENTIFRRECGIKPISLNELHAENYDFIFAYETSEIDERVTRLDAVWDTHSKLPENKETFADVRLELTATSMLVINYIRPFLEIDDDIINLCTALKYGIKSDLKSSGGHKKTEEESVLESELDDFIDEEVLEKISGAKLVKPDYWMLSWGGKVKISGSFSIFMMGFLHTDEYLWKHANLVREITEAVNTVLCIGIVNGQVIFKTRRSEDSAIDLREINDLIRGDYHSKNHDTEGSSGDRDLAGGGDFELLPKPPANLSSEDREKYADWLFADILKRISPLLTQDS